MSFSDFDLDPALLHALADLGFSRPTAIQGDAIPPALEGRDVVGTAMTGSGKTAAFLLPILNQLLDRPRGTTRALVVTPTRELAAQVEEHLRALAAHTDITSVTVYGGVGYEPQERAFRAGVDVVIATPGRLLDHLRRPYASLAAVEFLVLDEGDRMLDMGFIPDVRRILSQLPRERQTMLFSATMPAPIVSLAREFLRDPVTINLERKAAPATGITQVTYPVRHELKAALFLHLLERSGIENALAFTRTKDRADRLAAYLEAHGVSVTAIHGDRSQVHRSRALEAFKRGQYRVLVATDAAARGLDLVDLTHVINIDVPSQPEDYIHRVGRTARYEATGDAITFFSARELADIHGIERAIGAKLPRLTAEGFDYEPHRSAAPPATTTGGPRRAAPPTAAAAPASNPSPPPSPQPMPPAAGPDVRAQRAPRPPAETVPVARRASRPAPDAAPTAAGGEVVDRDRALERFSRLRRRRGSLAGGGGRPRAEDGPRPAVAAPVAERPADRRIDAGGGAHGTGGAGAAGGLPGPPERSGAVESAVERFGRLRARRAGHPGRRRREA